MRQEEWGVCQRGDTSVSLLTQKRKKTTKKHRRHKKLMITVVPFVLLCGLETIQAKLETDSEQKA